MPRQVAPDTQSKERKRNGASSLVFGAPFVIGVGVMLAVGLTAFSGCTSEVRYRVLTTLVDGVPPPGTPRPERRRRRLAKTHEPPPVEVELEVAEPEEVQPRYETYAALLAAFPRDLMGNVDWVGAVAEGRIDPQPGIDPEATATPVLPFDVHLDPGIPQFEVTFPHAAHTYWLRCDNCHPQIFTMRAGANPITMAKIFEGEYCGRCHGKVAFPPETGCPRCHTKLGGASG